EQVDARGAQFNGAMLTQSHWKDCRLDGANFSESTADSLYMNGCSLQGALFTNVRWNKTNWAQCHGEDLDLSGAQLQA
ncbi:pentapeptide repeat-containing protein, partial [Salmonella enterica subsp. enterica serovar Pomona]